MPLLRACGRRFVVAELDGIAALADAWDAQADTLDAYLECTSPAYGAPGLSHCAACCYGTLRVIKCHTDQAHADVADALRAGARLLRTELAEQAAMAAEPRPVGGLG